MGVMGKYVDRFALASHALPAGMHMDSDYPFMIPRIESFDGTTITIVSDRDGSKASAPVRFKDGKQYFTLKQSSTYERLFGRKPASFTFHPFKDEQSVAIGKPSSC